MTVSENKIFWKKTRLLFKESKKKKLEVGMGKMGLIDGDGYRLVKMKICACQILPLPLPLPQQ